VLEFSLKVLERFYNAKINILKLLLDMHLFELECQRLDRSSLSLGLLALIYTTCYYSGQLRAFMFSIVRNIRAITSFQQNNDIKYVTKACLKYDQIRAWAIL
jgi:hypothetical protein